MKEVIIVGAGGHAKVVADIVKLNGDQVIGYLDDKDPKELFDFNLIGTTKEIGDKDYWYFVAVGDCSIRKELMEKKAKWYTAIHPNSVIAESVVVSEGSCVMANAVINSDVKIGRGAIINTAATVDHDCNVGDFVHIAPGVHISGSVEIGNDCWIGVGSVISNNIKVCERCIVGAGAVVVKNLERAGTYIGIPARIREL